MATADTSALIASLELQDKFSANAKKGEAALNALDKAASGVDGSLGKVSKTSSALAQVKGGVLAGLGIGAGFGAVNALEQGVKEVVNVLGDFVTHGIEAEKTNSRLGASLKANIPNWNGNISAIEAYDDAGKRLGFTNNEMADSMAVLVGATHDVAKAQSILATAQDLARFKGISLAEATDALTRVDAGSYRILKSLGIQLSANATQTEALAAVQKVAGGQAAAYAETTAGAQAKLNAAWDDAQDKIGTALLPAVTALANGLYDAIPAAEGLVGSIGDIGKGAFDAVEPLYQLAAAINRALPKLGRKGEVLGSLADYQKGLKGLAVVTKESTSSVVMDLNRLSGGLQNSDFGMAAFAKRVTGDFPQMTTLGKKTDEAFVSGLKSGQNDVDSTWSDIIDGLQHPGRRATQIGHDIGILTSKALVTALRSSDPLIAAEARHEVDLITTELQSLDPTAKEAGKKGMAALVKAMHSSNPQVSAAAAAILAAINQNINQPTVAREWGLTIAQQVALGLGSNASVQGIEAAARRLMAAALAGLDIPGPNPNPGPNPKPKKPKPGVTPYNPRNPGPDGLTGGARLTVNVTTDVTTSSIGKAQAHGEAFGPVAYTGFRG